METSMILHFFHAAGQTLLRWCQHSVLWRLFNALYTRIARSWTNSAIVRSFCRAAREEGYVKNSWLGRFLYLPFAFLGLLCGPRGQAFARWVQRLRPFGWVYCAVENLYALNTRFLGVVSLFGGAVYLIAARSLLQPIALAAVIVGAVLCLFDVSLVRALGASVIDRLLRTLLRVSPSYDYGDASQQTKPDRLAIAAVCGIVCGFLAAYVSPLVAVGLLGAVVMLFHVEFALAVTVFAIPFVPTMAAAALVMVSFVSLLCKKMAAGDRAWRFDGVGMLVMAFLLVVIICSLTSVTMRESLSICLLYCLFIGFFFVVINAITTREQLHAVLLVFVLSGVLVALYGIIQYVFGLDMDKQVWLDEDMFTDIKMRAFSTLENPNVLGEYLLLVIPVCAAFLWCRKGFLSKCTFLGMLLVLLLCMVLTMSRGCWVGLLVAVAIFISFTQGRLWVLAVLGLFLLPSVLPESIMNRFLSIGNLQDTSSSYRLFIWLGTLRLLADFWPFGIGPGGDAFGFVYQNYMYAGITAPHAHNVYLQLAVEFGIGGLVVFLFVVFLFCRRMAASCHTLQKNGLHRVLIVAVSAGILSFLFQGLFDYVFYNYRVFLMFWMMLGLGMCLKYTAPASAVAVRDNQQINLQHNAGASPAQQNDSLQHDTGASPAASQQIHSQHDAGASPAQQSGSLQHSAGASPAAQQSDSLQHGAEVSPAQQQTSNLQHDTEASPAAQQNDSLQHNDDRPNTPPEGGCA